MSQNAHTLHLFFADSMQMKYCQLMFHHLCEDNQEKAQSFADKLGGVELSELWNPEKFFNGAVRAQSPGLLLTFDSSTHEGVPLRLLELLFARGLQSAVAEVFYDQVGETERMHFEKGLWVSRREFYERNPALQAAVNGPEQPREADEGNEEDEELPDGTRNPRKPVRIGKLREEREKQEREGQEAAEAMLGLLKGMRESGVSPVKGFIGVLLLRAAFKGLLHAVLFTVVTVLLFNGFWLWMGVGLVLMVVLPLYYVTAEHQSLRS